jgi:hypothetical protein
LFDFLTLCHIYAIFFPPNCKAEDDGEEPNHQGDHKVKTLTQRVQCHDGSKQYCKSQRRAQQTASLVFAREFRACYRYLDMLPAEAAIHHALHAAFVRSADIDRICHVPVVDLRAAQEATLGGLAHQMG